MPMLRSLGLTLASPSATTASPVPPTAFFSANVPELRLLHLNYVTLLLFEVPPVQGFLTLVLRSRSPEASNLGAAAQRITHHPSRIIHQEIVVLIAGISYNRAPVPCRVSAEDSDEDEYQSGSGTGSDFETDSDSAFEWDSEGASESGSESENMPVHELD
ncbi:hypothetical protein R3P38DRAFT_3223001 [Favolaschia claudopus]|uniref:Uncharacterized protein n=1 Tax=Favolaschia claudopus TaxID=2862362 RepID=A0AAV9ZYK5_9AGAR